MRPNGANSDIGAYEYYENDEAERVTTFTIPDVVIENDAFDEPVDYSGFIGVGIVIVILSVVYLIRAKMN